MTDVSTKTQSLCPHCLRRIGAFRIVKDDAVYLEKSCPEHGSLEKVLIWKNNPKNYNEWKRPSGMPVSISSGVSEDLSILSSADGCPYECGLCSNHKQSTCSVILEVTGRCNIHCPVCFASSETSAGADPDVKRIEQMLRNAYDTAGRCPIQLSGGEPTLRDDLPQIIAVARETGFDHIQVNTNGIRIAQDIAYGRALKDAGVTDFYLQFDGLTDDVYRRIRGADLLQIKLKALGRCAALRVGVILVPTLVKGVNDSQIGSIIQFAKKQMPTVKGVHYQPLTYVGRYPSAPRNEERMLIPDILMAIEKQTDGELKQENFIPPG